MLIALIFILSLLLMTKSSQNILPIYFGLFIPIPVYVCLMGVSFYIVMTLTIFFIYICSPQKTDKNHYLYKWILYFIYFFFLSRIIVTVLGTQTFNVLQQVNSLKAELPILILLPIYYWGIRQNKSIFKITSILIFIICLYGIYAYLTTSNPYLNFISQFFKNQKELLNSANNFISEQRGGLIGRLSGTTFNPIQYGILLNILSYSILFDIIINKKKNTFNYITICLVFINIYLTGSRGTLIAFIIPIYIFFLWNAQPIKRKKTILWTLIGGSIILLTPSFDKYTEPIKSLIPFLEQTSNQTIHGSSVDGRLLQYTSTILIISQNTTSLLWGLGYGATTDIIENYNIAGYVGEFEGEFLNGLITYGIIGCIIILITPYILCFKLLNKLKNKGYIKDSTFRLISCFILTKLTYGVLVGNVNEHLWYSFFILFCTLSVKSYKQTTLNNNNYL